jgi:HEAT repeat protein
MNDPVDNLTTLLAELTSGNDIRAEAAVQKLSALGGEAIPALKELLASPQADSRWWATWTLAEIRHLQVPPLLKEALHDPDVSVRQAAALALRVQPEASAIPDLIAIIDGTAQPGETDPTLAHLAAAALIALGEAAVPPLIRLLESGPQPARPIAARCLAGIGDKRAIPALFAALESSAEQGGSAVLEYWASAGLEKMGVGMSFLKPE